MKRVFVKKPVRVDVVEFIGSNGSEVCQFCGGTQNTDGTILIKSAGGHYTASVGDFIIQEKTGVFSSCSADKFHLIYDEVF